MDPVWAQPDLAARPGVVAGFGRLAGDDDAHDGAARAGFGRVEGVGDPRTVGHVGLVGLDREIAERVPRLHRGVAGGAVVVERLNGERLGLANRCISRDDHHPQHSERDQPGTEWSTHSHPL